MFFSFLHHKLDYCLQHHQDIGVEAFLHCIFRWVKPVVVRQSFYLLQQYSFRVLVTPPKQISPHPKKRRSNFQIFQREAHCMHSFPSVSFRKPSTAALVSSKHFHLQFWRATLLWSSSTYFTSWISTASSTLHIAPFLMPATSRRVLSTALLDR